MYTAQVRKAAERRLITAGISVKMQWKKGSRWFVEREKGRNIETNRCSQWKQKSESVYSTTNFQPGSVCAPRWLLLSLSFFDTANRGRNLRAGSFFFFLFFLVCACARVLLCLSVWLHAQTRASTLVNTHMSKVFVTLLTHCFSVLLLPWKHRNHGNKRCGVWGGWGGVWVFFFFDEIGVFLSKSRPRERDSDSERCKFADEARSGMYENLLPVRNDLLPRYSF